MRRKLYIAACIVFGVSVAVELIAFVLGIWTRDDLWGKIVFTSMASALSAALVAASTGFGLGGRRR